MRSKLTDSHIKALISKEKPYKVSDSEGLTHRKKNVKPRPESVDHYNHGTSEVSNELFRATPIHCFLGIATRQSWPTVPTFWTTAFH